MVRTGSALALGGCTDTTSWISLVSMGDTAPTYRVAFGDLVIDAPNRAATAGLTMGLYTWNRGTNQQMRIEGGSPTPGAFLQLRMVHSSLLLEAVGSTVAQNQANTASQTQTWELVDPRTTSIQSKSRTKIVNTGAKPAVDALGRALGTPSAPWMNWSH
jgi:hypothetical protein